MILLGIDPGISGAYAVLHGDAVVQVEDLPVFVHIGRKRRTELDLATLGDTLEALHIEHVFLERVAARPRQGVTSMFRFGFTAGAICGLLTGMNIPMSFVTPQVWQRHHGIGPSPDAARQRAMQLFPSACSCLAKKRDANRADALLIASYGLQKLNGSSTPLV